MDWLKNTEPPKDFRVLNCNFEKTALNYAEPPQLANGYFSTFTERCERMADRAVLQHLQSRANSDWKRIWYKSLFCKHCNMPPLCGPVAEIITRSRLFLKDTVAFESKFYYVSVNVILKPKAILDSCVLLSMKYFDESANCLLSNQI